jgi:metal-responsive CopG/Arc/MetJ family transcriptional regulator
MKTRVQFDFTSEQLAMLDKLKKKMGASSRAEVVRRALKLLESAIYGDVWMRGEDAILRKLEII